MSEGVGWRVIVNSLVPSGSLGPQKGPVFKPRRGVQVKPWQWAWLGCRWLVRLGVLFFAFNIYTYHVYSFIEVGESKFIRVQWKRLFPCAVHVSLLSVRSHVSCLSFSERLLIKHLENTQSKHSGVAFICAMNCSVRISSFYRTQTINPM